MKLAEADSASSENWRPPPPATSAIAVRSGDCKEGPA